MISKYFLLFLTLFISLVCGCQSTLETAEQIKSVNESLQKTSGLKMVVLSVERNQLIIAASDPSFETMSEEQKEEKAKSLAQTALAQWGDKSAITELLVNFSAKEISEGYSDTFKFPAKDIQATESPSKPGET